MSRDTRQHDAAGARAAATALRPLGWAGLLLPVPVGLRLYRVEGDARQGRLGLADGVRPRLEIAWARVRTRRFDGQRFAIRRLRRTLTRGQARELDQWLTPVDNRSFEPLLHLRADEQRTERWAGYCPTTGRVIEAAYHGGEEAEDRLLREHSFPRLVDQPVDGPTRWAMFDTSFTAPASFEYQSARLNMGDILVRLRCVKGWRRPRLTIRQIYPATLALSRQPLEAWMRDLLTEMAGLYRRTAPRGVAWDGIQTPRGAGLIARARLRLALRPLRWRTPRLLTQWLVHDVARNRLLALSYAGFPGAGAEDQLLHALLEGVHWADTAPQEAS